MMPACELCNSTVTTMVYAGMSSRAKEGKKVLELQLWRKELRRKRFDAVSERLERLELREEHNEKAQQRQVSIQGGGFESRPQLQREKAKNTHASDFNIKLQQQRKLGKNMFNKGQQSREIRIHYGKKAS